MVPFPEAKMASEIFLNCSKAMKSVSLCVPLSIGISVSSVFPVFLRVLCLDQRNAMLMIPASIMTLQNWLSL